MKESAQLSQETNEQIIPVQREMITIGGGAVNSVNGQTGDVVLTTSDLENDSDYQTGSEVESAISSAIADKQDALTAGDNITIEDNTISATDTTYTAGANVSISDENVISATDTTYSNFTGTDGNTGGTSGLVPAPATTDAGKFLKADGTWDTAGGGGPTVVQTTGNSQTDVMSQDATTKLVYVDSNLNKINIRGTNGTDGSTGAGAIGIGSPSFARGEGSVSIGQGSQIYSDGVYSVAIGNSAATNNNSRAVALGNAAEASNNNSVAIGTNAKTTRAGEVNVGANDSGRGYNNTNYRVIGGVHDGQLDNDAATVGQINATIDAINTALSTNIPHIGA